MAGSGSENDAGTVSLGVEVDIASASRILDTLQTKINNLLNDLNVKVTLDPSKAIEELGQLTAQMKQLQGQAATLSSAMKSAAGISDEQALQRKLAITSSVAEQLRSQIAYHERVRAGILEEGAALDANTAKIKELNAQLVKQGTLEQAERSMNLRNARFDVGGGAAMLGQMANFTVDAAAFFGPVTAMKNMWDEAYKLDKAFADFQARTASTSTEMQSFRTVILGVAADSKFSSSELVESAAVMGKLGFSAKEVQGSLASIVQFAQATGAELKEAFDTITHAMIVFNLRADETTKITDMMTSAINHTKLNPEMMGTAFQYASNEVKDANVSLTEFIAVQAMAANAGIRSGSMIGTGIRQLLTELENPSQKLKDELASVGLSTDTINIKADGLIGTMRKLAESGFTSENALRGLDLRAAHLFSALSRGALDSDALVKSLMQSGTTAEASDRAMGSLAASSERLHTNLGIAAEQGFRPVLDALTGLTGWLASATTASEKFGATLPTITSGLVAMGAAWAAFRVGGLVTGLMGGAAGVLGGIAAVAPWAMLVAAVVAAGAAYVSFGEGVKTSAQRLDEAKTSYDRASSSLNENKKAVQDVDKAMVDLAAKGSGPLKDSELVVANLRNQFGSLGLQIGDNVRDVQGLINALQNLKDTFPGKLEGDIQDQIAALRAQAAEQGPKVASAREGFDTSMARANSSGAIGLGLRKSLWAVRDYQGTVGSGDWYNTTATAKGNMTDALAHATDEQQAALQKVKEAFDKLIGAQESSINITTKQADAERGLAEARMMRDPNSVLSRSQAMNQTVASQQRDIGDYVAASRKSYKDGGDGLGLKGVRDQAENTLTLIKTEVETQVAEIDKVKEKTPALAKVRDELMSRLTQARAAFEDAEKAYADDHVKALTAWAKTYGLDAQAAEAHLGDKSNSSDQIRAFGGKAGDFLTKQHQDRLALLNEKAVGTKDTGDAATLQAEIQAENEGFKSAMGRLNLRVKEALQAQVARIDKTFSDNQSLAFTQIATTGADAQEQYANAKVQAERPTSAAQIRLAQTRANYNTDPFAAISAGRQTESLNTGKMVQKYQELLDANAQTIKTFDKLGGDLTIRADIAAENLDRVKQEIAASEDPNSEPNQQRLIAAKKLLEEADKKAIENAKTLTSLDKEREGYEVSLAQARANAPPTTMGEALTGGWNQYADQAGLSKSSLTLLRDQVPTVLSTASSAFSTFAMNVATGTKSVKDSFKQMAMSIIQSLGDIAMKQVATGIFGGLGNMFGFGSSKSPSGADLGNGPVNPGPQNVIGMSELPAPNWTGGLIRAASGYGPVSTRDSVPILAAPGEFVMRQSAVDLIGADNLSMLNAKGNNYVSQVQNPANQNNQNNNTPSVVNVWVVNKDQQPPAIGPKDVMAIWTQDVLTGGQGKKLIKQIMAGTA